jgi:hypothetical protein
MITPHVCHGEKRRRGAAGAGCGMAIAAMKKKWAL